MSVTSFLPGFCLATTAALLVAAPCPPARAQEGARARAIELELNTVRNYVAGTPLVLKLDHPDAIYRGGDTMTITAEAAADGHLYLLYADATGDVRRVFPNVLEPESRVKAGQIVQVPPVLEGERPEDRAKLRVGPPFGDELVKAIFSREPVKALENLRGVNVIGQAAVDLDVAKGVVMELTRTNRDWTEKTLKVRTLAPGSEPPPRRVGVFVGIDRYRSLLVPRLVVCKRDAEALADQMKRNCRVDEVIVLTDENATLENLRDLIQNKLPEKTRPGDVVIFYWSGHGGTCADLDGDEDDHLDEYLVPYNGELDNLETERRTMLLDDTFGRWLDRLNGRRLVLVLDTCHSGGQAKEAGTLSRAFDFDPGARPGAKDVNQVETAVLVSSAPDQLSFVRPQRDHSVMTHFLLQRLREAREPLTLKQVHAYLETTVPAFIRKSHPGAEQTPQLYDRLRGPFFLRP